MKKKAALFSLTILLLFLATGLTACNERNRIFRYGYWQYIVVGKESRIPKNKNDSVIAVVGLTESGAEQLALDVPSAINGTEVAYLGFEKYDIAINYYAITSRNLLRLYIPENILSIKPYVFESLSAPDAKIIYNGAAEPRVHFSSSPEIYVYRELYEKSKANTPTFRRRRLYRLPVMSMDFGNIRTCQRSVFEQLLRSSQQRIFQG